MQPIFANFATMDNPLPWIILACVVLVLFGGGKLKGFMKELGEGVSELKKATNEPKPDETVKTASDAGATTSAGTKKES
jgi:TatA/E family protein of Tat protein translocase